MNAPSTDQELSVRVRQVRWEAENVVSLELAGRDGGQLPPWEPGAHLEITLPSGLIRHYSLCGQVSDRSKYMVAVLREAGGRGGSAEAHDTALVGRELRVRGPRNQFPLRPAGEYVFVAGGIGITPVLSMIRQATEHHLPWTLHYGGRTAESMAFAPEIHRLGLAAGATVRSAPEARSEGAPGDPRAHARDFEVVLARTGDTVTVTTGVTILEAVRELRPEVLYSCEEGFCGTCETKVLGGAPAHRDTVLPDDERASNASMMLCVGSCASRELVLDL